MSTKNYLTHKVTDTPPTFSDVGDEYFNPKNNTLYKKVVYSGTNVAWTQIISTGTDGNINLTGNSISFLANNRLPIYFGATAAPSISNTIYVGINTTGYINGNGGVYNNRTAGPNANVSIFFQTKGNGGILTSVPDPNYVPLNTVANGNPGGYRGIFSVDLQLQRSDSTYIASGAYSAILGGYDNAASGTHSAVIGSNGSRASAPGSVAVGGQNIYSDGNYSVILGGQYATTRGIQFYNVLTNNGIGFGTASTGVTSYAHGAIMSLLGDTSTTTPTRILTTSGSTLVTTSSPNRNVLILPNNSLIGFKGTLVAIITGGPGSGNAVWTFEGSIGKGASAVSTALIGTPTISLMAIDGVAITNGWSFEITADKTNGALSMNVRGDTANNIRWYCRLETTEVTF